MSKVSLIDGHIDNETKQTNYERIRNMTDEEIADKLARISAQAQTNTDQALERILTGQ